MSTPPGTIRIVAGRHRGRRLKVPQGGDVRPTSDRVRESLFNILAHRDWRHSGGRLPRDARVLDVFAGSGALGLEALSRGAAEVLFLESDKTARTALDHNIEALDEVERAFVLPRDATQPGPRPGTEPFGLVLADAPYGSGLAAVALAALAAQGWLGPHTVAVMELDAKEPFDPPAGFIAAVDRRYGNTRLVFLEEGGASG